MAHLISRSDDARAKLITQACKNEKRRQQDMNRGLC